MHSDQIYVDEALARDLIFQQFPVFRGEDIVALESAGTVNANFRICSNYAAHLPSRMMDPVECTGCWMRRQGLARNSTRIARSQARSRSPWGRPRPAYPSPWLVQTWVEGDVATPNRLSASSTFALDLARLIAPLRTADLKGRTFDGRGGNLLDHDGWMEECFTRNKNLLDVKFLRRLWEDFRKLPSARHEVMSHKDLIPANLLVRGGRLAGVLDTEAFGPSDPSLDLVAAWHLLDRGNRAIFRKALQVDDLEWKRGAASAGPLSMQSLGAMLLLALMCGLSIPITKLGLGSIPPMTLTALHFMVAVPLIMFLARRELRLPARAVLPVIGLGVMGITLGNVAQSFAAPNLPKLHAI